MSTTLSPAEKALLKKATETLSPEEQSSQKRIQAVLKKMQEGTLEILGTPEERLASAQRIADKIVHIQENEKKTPKD